MPQRLYHRVLEAAGHRCPGPAVLRLTLRGMELLSVEVRWFGVGLQHRSMTNIINKRENAAFLLKEPKQTFVIIF